MNGFSHPWDNIPDSWSTSGRLSKTVPSSSTFYDSSSLKTIKAQSLNHISQGIKGASSAVSTGLMASGVAAPVGAAMQMSSALGSMVTQGLSTREQGTINQQYLKDLNTSNVMGSSYASQKQQNAQNALDYKTNVSSLGSTFGPLAALIGWGVGSLGSPKVENPTVNSFAGGVDPVANNVNQSASTI